MLSQFKFPRVLLAAALSFALGLTACGGGGGGVTISGGAGGSSGGGSSGGGSGGAPVTPPGGSTSNGTNCDSPTSADVDGCTYVSLGDATSDFLTYTVKVTAISITLRNGIVADLVPASTTVNFAQYTSLTEFLTLNAVPAGDYVSASITFDFTGADIEAQDASGKAVKLKPVDSAGKSLGKLTLNINFDANHPLGLFPGATHILGLDFDLNASNIINSDNTVTVNPVMVASVDPDTTTAIAVRGPLSATSTGSDSFTLGLRPFQAGDADYGDVNVFGNASTVYIVDQKIYVGSAGVAALASAGDKTAVLAQGSFNFGNHHFVATEVLAGSSVPGGSVDAVEGVVVARSGNTLTLAGSSLYHTSKSVTFDDTATVDLADSTVVSEIDKPNTPEAIANISVGQRILAFGNFGSGGNATQLDVTSGFVLREFTDVDGSVLSLVDNGENSSVNLDVATIANRPVAMFDFTGTNSDPTNYEVALPCSCLNTGVNIGDPVIVSGFSPKFGTAPPDFAAQALTDFNLADSVLSVAWGSGTTKAFTSVEVNSGIVVNISGSPIVHNLREGAEVTDLSLLPSVPAVVTKDLGVFAILKDGNLQVYVKFSDFVTALDSALSAGNAVKGFFAVGGYDSADSLLQATEVTVILK
ncbi:MAG TPA: hypothetical protein VGM47_06740 [Gammaproteobacteria bacterium]